MIAQEDFRQAFQPFAPPRVLSQLFHFSAHLCGQPFNHDFCLDVQRAQTALEAYTNHPRILNALIPFAVASNSLSGYALWTPAAQLSLNDAPVLLFHPKHGLHAIANNSREFIQLLALDALPEVYGQHVSFEREAPHPPSAQVGTYRRWMEDTLEISAVDHGNDIVSAARWEHQHSLDKWLQRQSRTAS